MDKNKLNHFKQLLLKEKKEVTENISRINEYEPNDSMQEYFDELSTYDNHPADLGTELYMVGQMNNLKNHEKLITDEINISLNKIEDGSFGKCDICGKDIGEERLEVLPYAKICIDCANDKIPIEDMIHYRPKEEEILEFPYGRSFKDVSIEDYTGFDGEDSWQAVARYNEIPNDPSDNTGDHQGYYDEREPGIVEEVEMISEDYYKGQLEGMNREDIPDEQRKDK